MRSLEEADVVIKAQERRIESLERKVAYLDHMLAILDRDLSRKIEELETRTAWMKANPQEPKVPAILAPSHAPQGVWY